ncbi:hypothetical protein ACZ91_09570 [Streptomyces regensis]|nr:hypothetical protein ACZ91_09570 [Streptomyces regensis]
MGLVRIGRYVVRTGVATAAAGAVAMGSVGFGGIAHAQEAEPSAESEPKVIEGECASLLKGKEGEPLTVDALAAVNAEGVAGIGTGEESSERGALLSLPLKETLDGLGISRAKVVVNPLGQICDTAQSTVNAVASVPRELTKPTPEEPEEPEQPAPEDPEPEPEPAPEPEQPDEPETPGNGDSAPGAPDHLDDLDLAAEPVPGPGAVAAPLDPVSLPPAAGITVPKAPVGPGMGVPEKGSKPGEQENAARKSGTAQALPQASEHDRTPLVLSVAALLVVIAALSRSWIARKNA